MATIFYYPTNDRLFHKVKHLCFKVYQNSWLTLLGIIMLIQTGWSTPEISRLHVTISQSGATANACVRTLTANVSGGSGNYSYSWSATTPDITLPGPVNAKTIQLALHETTGVLVYVSDPVSGRTGSATTTVSRILLGSFDIFIPNVFTPNGDGYNDTWMVMDADIGYGAINAYRYDLTIANQAGSAVYARSSTVTSGAVGLTGGDIYWNGRLHGTGSYVQNGTYQYNLRLYNCSGNQLFQGNIDIYGASRNRMPYEISVYPQPATDLIKVRLTTAEINEDISEYELKIFDKDGKLVKSKESDKRINQWDVSQLLPGTYYLHFTNREGMIRKQILIE